MDISEHELRTMMREVDESHRDGLAELPAQIAELHEGEGRRLRAGHVAGLGSAGLAVAVGSALIPVVGLVRASAQQGDAGVAAFAQSVELAAVEAYKAAAASGKVKTQGVLDAATMFAGHHTEHAAAFGSAAGSSASNKPNPKLLAAVAGQLTAAADEKAVIKIAFDLEQAAAATYLFALGALTSADALKLTASILPVEAQHAVVLGQVLALDAAMYLPKFETQDAAVKPADYPVG